MFGWIMWSHLGVGPSSSGIAGTPLAGQPIVASAIGGRGQADVPAGSYIWLIHYVLPSLRDLGGYRRLNLVSWDCWQGLPPATPPSATTDSHWPAWAANACSESSTWFVDSTQLTFGGLADLLKLKHCVCADTPRSTIFTLAIFGIAKMPDQSSRHFVRGHVLWASMCGGFAISIRHFVRAIYPRTKGYVYHLACSVP